MEHIISIISGIFLGLFVTYLSQKGKNQATKEDIAEITNQIESVKNELSYTNLRKHEYLKKFESHLNAILDKSMKLMMLKNILFFLSNDLHSKEKVTQLINDIQETLSDLIYESRIARMMYWNNEELKTVIQEIIMVAQSYAKQISISANNYRVCLTEYEKFDKSENGHNAIGMSNVLSDIEKLKIDFKDVHKKEYDLFDERIIQYQRILIDFYKEKDLYGKLFTNP